MTHIFEDLTHKMESQHPQKQVIYLGSIGRYRYAYSLHIPDAQWDWCIYLQFTTETT